MSNRNQKKDRLSELPEPLLLHILFFLPTKYAVRTSVLARRYRRLWTASASFDFYRSDFPHRGHLFNVITSSFLRLRDPSAPLVRFCLRLGDPSVALSQPSAYRPFPIKLTTNWLNRAYSLGMRDLSLHTHTETIASLFPLILSFGSLHSLDINCLDSNIRYSLPLPPTFPLIQLKSLSTNARMCDSDLITFIMKQKNLEYLCIESPPTFDLSSQSVKILKLISTCIDSNINLSLPKLEFLDLSVELNQFHGEMPVLRKALVKTSSLWEGQVPALCDILKSITNVSVLTLHIGTPYPKGTPSATGLRKLNIDHPFVEPGKDMPMFPNLRSLKLSMCFYENAIQDLICLLHHSPVIDSLYLFHVERPSHHQMYRGVPEDCHSKLPLNSKGNRKYVYFSNLQTGDKKSRVIKLLSGERSSKRILPWSFHLKDQFESASNRSNPMFEEEVNECDLVNWEEIGTEL